MRKTYGFIFFTIVMLLLSPAIFLKKLQVKWTGFFDRGFSRKSLAENQLTIDKITLDNQILKSQITYIQEWIGTQQKFEDFFSELKKLEKTQQLALTSQEQQKKRIRILQDFLQHFSRYAFAKIIFKEPFSSSSYAWINLGELYNQKIGGKILAKNSPVVVGDVLVGIVEEVFLNYSKIRLITDPNLVVSVRALRGDQQLKNLDSKVMELLDCLELTDDFNWIYKEPLKETLGSLHEQLEKDGNDRFYAYGEIYGREYSPFLAFQNELIGDGFHLKVEDRLFKVSSIKGGFKDVIIKKGDLLVTTGLDGLFPKGLKVGIVTSVSPSQVGKIAQKIKARSIVENIHELQFVQVLPPNLDRDLSL